MIILAWEVITYHTYLYLLDIVCIHEVCLLSLKPPLRSFSHTVRPAHSLVSK